MHRRVDVPTIGAVVVTLLLYFLGIDLWLAFAIAAVFLVLVTVLAPDPNPREEAKTGNRSGGRAFRAEDGGAGDGGAEGNSRRTK